MRASLTFWQTKTLDQMTDEEWDVLCDGCAKCCLHKLEDQDTGIVYYTNVVCQLLDSETYRCRDYKHRKTLIKDCVVLTGAMEQCDWLPSTCAYRLIAEGKPLPSWHHLISGDANSVHDAGVSVRGRVVSEIEDIEDLQDHIVEWPL